MPTRRDVFVNKGIYHIYSKSIDKKQIFQKKDFCDEFLGSINFYKAGNNLRYSTYKKQDRVFFHRDSCKQSVEILCFCLMPNHYHLIIKQLAEQGIVRFMANILNSFTKHYNAKNKRKGSVFLTPFRSRQIVTDEQFKHTSRYVHLNPYSSGVVKSTDELLYYPFSSLTEYLNKVNEKICNTSDVLAMFGGDRERYLKFVLDNAQYQRTREYIKYAKDWL